MLTWILPGCMSAWKKPSRNTWVKNKVTPSLASCGMLTPALRKASVWLMGMPYIRSMTKTLVRQYSQTISGIKTKFKPSILRRNCAALEASRTKSSSSCKCLSNSATTSRGLSRLPSFESRSTHMAMLRMRSKSLSITLSMPGRNTFTATSRSGSPLLLRSRAKWTCATDALATGVCSKWLNTSSSFLPKAFSIMATACAEGKGGTWSCSLASSSEMSSGNKSRRVDSTWPNLTNTGPKRSKAKRRRSPRGARKFRPKVSTRERTLSQGCLKPESSNSSRPKRRTTQTMNTPRSMRIMRGVP